MIRNLLFTVKYHIYINLGYAGHWITCLWIIYFREMGMMGSPSCLMETMCAADLKYPNESYSPKHGALYADPRGKDKSFL